MAKEYGGPVSRALFVTSRNESSPAKSRFLEHREQLEVTIPAKYRRSLIDLSS